MTFTKIIKNKYMNSIIKYIILINVFFLSIKDTKKIIMEDLKYDYNFFVEKYFESNNLVQFVIDSFNTIYDNLEEMLSDINLVFEVPNINKENTKIKFKIQNLRFISPVTYQDYPEDKSLNFPKTPLEALNTLQTYSTKIIGDVKITLSKLPVYDPNNDFTRKIINILNGREQYIKSIFDPLETREIIIQNAAEFMIPIMVGSKHCITTKLSKRQKWNIGLDPLSDGGFFIINGVEYAYQNTASYNFNSPTVIHNNFKKENSRAGYLAQKNIMYGTSYQSVFIIHQMKEDDLKITTYNYDLGVAIHAKNIHIVNPDKENYIPLGLLFKVYGAINDTDIINYVDRNGNNPSLQEFLIECLKKGYLHRKCNYSGEMTRDEALHEIGKLLIHENELKKIYEMKTKFQNESEETIEKLINFRIKETTLRILNDYFMININSNPGNVCYEMGNIIRKLYMAKQSPENQTDRDNLENRRVQLIGMQMVLAFQSILSNTFFESGKKIYSDIKNVVYKTLPKFKVSTYFDEGNRNVEQLKEAIQKFSNSVSINFNKIFLSRDVLDGRKQSRIVPLIIEHVTKAREYATIRDIVIRETSKDSVVGYDQRKIHPSHFGFLCPVQTPEGSGVGKYQQPTYPCYITIPKNPAKIIEWIKSTDYYIENPEKSINIGNYLFISVNNSIIGYCKKENGFKLYEKSMEYRAKNDRYLSVVLEREEYTIDYYTDCGRMMIPLINIEKYYESSKDEKFISSINSITWNDLIEKQIIEYFDPKMMAYNSLVAETIDKANNGEYNYTHILMPEGIYGNIPVSNPFTNTLKSSRSIISTSQVKHNISIPCYNFTTGTYKDIKILHHPHRQMIGSVVDNKMFGGAYPMYENVVVTFKHATYNQDDACVMNDSCLYRNMFAISIFKVFENIKNKQKESYIIGTAKAEGMAGKNFNIIDPAYAVPTSIGYKVNDNTVLIAKAIMQSKIIDKSIVYNKISASAKGNNEELTGNKYVITSNSVPDIYKNVSYKMVRCQLSLRTIVGNKFLSINAQKGVLGLAVEQHKLDISDDGIIPSIIMNPSSITSRETYGIALEPYFADYVARKKGSILINQFANKDELFDEIENIDLYKKFYNGRNGDELTNKLLTGLISYSAQEMLVGDKIHVRDKGGRNPQTRDPLKGKQNGGGASIGSMEVDALIAAGIMKSMKTENGRNSSNSTWTFCKICKTMSSYYDRLSNCFKCTRCGKLNEEDISVNGLCYKSVIFDSIMRGQGNICEYSD